MLTLSLMSVKCTKVKVTIFKMLKMIDVDDDDDDC